MNIALYGLYGLVILRTLWTYSRFARVVEECSLRAEAVGVSRGGVYRSENAGMSNNKGSENLPRRKSKVSWATRIAPGLVDPKARPKGVTDGRAG